MAYMCWFLSTACVVSPLALLMETMDGMLRSLMFFGIFNAKFKKIVLSTPVFVCIQPHERAAEKGGTVLALGEAGAT